MAVDIENIGSTDPNFSDSMAVIGSGAINVKTHFGAVGDGVTDDTAAIQAALDFDVLATNALWNGWNGDADAGAGTDYSGARGGIYFPPGRYLITEALIPTGTSPDWIQSQGRLFAHPGSVLLKANFAGFIIDNENPDPEGDPPTGSFSFSLIIEGIYFWNESATGGCVRLYSNMTSNIRNCHFKGHHGLLLGGGPENGHIAFDSLVEMCTFNGIGTEGAWSANGVGCSAGHHVLVQKCNFTLWDVALTLSGAQASAIGNRFEINNIAIKNGQRNDLTTAGTNNGGVIINSSFESNKYDIWIAGASGLTIDGVQSQGDTVSHDSQASFYYVSGSNITVNNYATSGDYDLAGFYMAGNGPVTSGYFGCIFSQCTGDQGAGVGVNVADHWATNSSIYFACTVAQLPTGLYGGARRWVNNANQVYGTDAIGTAITGGGAQTVLAALDPGGTWRLAL
jgi:hypothetical protein